MRVFRSETGKKGGNYYIISVLSRHIIFQYFYHVFLTGF